MAEKIVLGSADLTSSIVTRSARGHGITVETPGTDGIRHLASAHINYGVENGMAAIRMEH